MVDICLELPDWLIQHYERRATCVGKTAEDLMREIIEASAPKSAAFQTSNISLDDEPIVKAADIEKEYRRLGYRLGWRFITCPQGNADQAKLLLVTLNPAGREQHGPAWSQEAGSAYRVESWNGLPEGKSVLQRQVQKMFDCLNVRDEEVFSANYVPFRSPSWAELDRRPEAEAFASSLWQWLKPKVRFERIVCVGKDQPGKAIAALFDAQKEGSFSIGWGTVTADRYRLPDGRQMVALPHLSRFGIFGRKRSDEDLKRLFEL